MTRTATPPPAHPRIAERRDDVAAARDRRDRRRRWSGVVLAALFLAGAALVRSPLLAVANVDVVGVTGERAAAVERAAGIELGDPLVGLPVDAAAAAVADLAWVRDAHVRRTTSQTVRIAVVVRPPAAVVRTGTAAWLLDADGVVIGGGVEPGLVTIEAPDRTLPPVGEEVRGPILDALAVHAGLPDDLRSRVVSYDAGSLHRLTATVEGERGREWLVVFGDARRLEDKAVALRLLLEEVSRRDDVDVDLDIRAPTNPVLVPRSDGERGSG